MSSGEGKNGVGAYVPVLYERVTQHIGKQVFTREYKCRLFSPLYFFVCLICLNLIDELFQERAAVKAPPGLGLKRPQSLSPHPVEPSRSQGHSSCKD